MVVAYRYEHFKREVLRGELSFRTGPLPGEPFPDFDLETTDDGRVRKADYTGRRPVLITLGSVTCPMTRSAGPVLKRLYGQFGGDVQFVTLYVREAHPGERYPQPGSFREKIVNARVYRERDRIPWPIAVDGIEGALHRSLDNKANAVYIIDIDGNVAFRALWSNDYNTLYDALVRVQGMKRGAIGQSEKDVVPMMRGTGEMYDTLKFAGRRAGRDVLRELPPLYAVARVAALFRPLSPLARTVAAIAGIGAAAGVAALLLARRSPHTSA
jgi:hypothetical protein